MALFGLSPKDYPEPVYGVWPDNWRAVSFFAAVPNGAWNMGPRGPAGMRPEALREVRLALGITKAEWPAIFDSLRYLEEGALAEIHKED